jgi:predicted RNase H-like HicB family nuclease
MDIRYPYTVELQPEGTYLVQFLDFEEGFAEGKTLEEAAEYAQEVLHLLLLTYADEGRILPPPSEVGSLPFCECAPARSSVSRIQTV